MLAYKEFKVGEVIRYKKTLEVYLVVAKSSAGVFIVNLQTRNNPAILQFILPYQATEYEKDSNIGDIGEWEQKQHE